MEEGGVWGPYNQGKSWKEKMYPRGKKGKKIFS
jgi:hypothetical protein